jgi:Glycosyltransferase family 87
MLWMNDFVAYWSAGRLLAQGQNPYDGDAVLQIQRGFDIHRSSPLIMRNPPWALPLAAPLGFLQLPTAQLLCLFMAMAAVLVSVQILWRLYLGSSPPWLAGVIAGVFSPLPVALSIGQMSPLLLLGVSGLLYFANRRQYGRAGASMFLLALKPHVVWLLWPVLLLYSVQQRRWRMLLIFSLLFSLACMLTLLIDPSAFGEYLAMSRKVGLLEELTPTTSGLLRSWTGAALFQFVPITLAAVWFLYYWLRSGVSWEWRAGVPLLLLVSVCTTSYSWFFDQIVLLPCIFHGMAWVIRGSGKKIFFSSAAFLIINGAALTLILMHRTSFWYAWTAPAWLFWYLAAATTAFPRNQGLE